MNKKERNKPIGVFDNDIGGQIIKGLIRRLISDASCYTSDTIGELVALTWEILIELDDDEGGQ